MKVLLADGLRPKAQELLKQNNIDIVVKFYKLDELISVIAEFDGIIVRSATKVPKEVIDAGVAGKLKVIGRAGTGIDNIDHKYARSIGVPVLNTPGANSASVSELVFAHLWALARFIPAAKVTMGNGEWNKKAYQGIELSGKTLGICGFGKIGQITAKIALDFGMKVIAFDINEVSTDLDVKIVTKEELIKTSDFITLHVPKLEKPFIGKEELGMMKDSSFLVNCARGGVVDEKALLDALNNGVISGAGIDAWENEPKFNPELAAHPKVSATPHIGASTEEAQDRVGFQIAEKIIAELKK